MIFGTRHGNYVITAPTLTPAGNMQIRVGVKRTALGDCDRPGGWQQIATVVLTPDEVLDLWRAMRQARVDAELEAWEEQFSAE